MKSKVVVLLSVYNGEKYLSSQLDSLYNQKDVDVCILARDDGSSDSSLAILERYKYLYGKLIILKGKNIGCSLSFYTLLQYAYDNLSDYNYFSFCDQDDVWMEYKLSISINHLIRSKKLYSFFHSSYYIADENLNILSKSKYVNSTIENCILSNFCLGCTQVFNKALLEKILLVCKFQLENGIKPILHDALTSMVAFSLDADIYFYENPLMYYRQHSSNVIGISNNILLNNYSRIKRLFFSPDSSKSKKCYLILNSLSETLDIHYKEVLDMCSNYKSNCKTKLNLLIDKRMYSRGLIYSIGFVISVVINKF